MINANGLPGFIQSFDIVKLLEDAEKADQLKLAKRYQEIYIRTVVDKLNKLAS